MVCAYLGPSLPSVETEVLEVDGLCQTNRDRRAIAYPVSPLDRLPDWSRAAMTARARRVDARVLRGLAARHPGRRLLAYSPTTGLNRPRVGGPAHVLI